MSDVVDVRVPDIGDFKDVEIVDVLVSVGDTVTPEDPLITLETDKAAMDVPSPVAGRIEALNIKTGDRVSAGDVILSVAADAQPTAAEGDQDPSAVPAATTVDSGEMTDADIETRLVVLGAGVGGYTAAFRAADLGLDVTLIERWPTLGGVCLNVGCIPSKALLHAARVIEDAESMALHGLDFGRPDIDAARLRAWKDKIVTRLTGGLTALAKQRKVRVLKGVGRFISPYRIEVSADGDTTLVGFRHCIIAAGSESARLPGLPNDPRIMDSTDALELDELPQRMLVVGGGIIGLELATVYDALGVHVSVAELTGTLMPGCDRDLCRPLEKRIASRYERILLNTRVTGMTAEADGIRVEFAGNSAVEPQVYGRVLIAVGRRANGDRIGADRAGVTVSEQNLIAVDKHMRTNVPHIFAIGDIVGEPMLAHKATHEGKVAAEVAAGQKRAFDARVIPSVAYTDPEVAWVGVTEEQAKAEGRAYGKGVFPWLASGRSLALNRDEGVTKLLFDEATHRVIGAGITGTNAGDLISEVALAIEMGCEAADIGLTVHPHPTLSETVAFAAEAFDGTLTDLYLPRK